MWRRKNSNHAWSFHWTIIETSLNDFFLNSLSVSVCRPLFVHIFCYFFLLLISWNRFEIATYHRIHFVEWKSHSYIDIVKFMGPTNRLVSDWLSVVVVVVFILKKSTWIHLYKSKWNESNRHQLMIHWCQPPNQPTQIHFYRDFTQIKFSQIDIQKRSQSESADLVISRVLMAKSSNSLDLWNGINAT